MRKIKLENGNVVEISEESYQAFFKASKDILVPECIKIEEARGLLCINNNYGQSLYYSELDNIYVAHIVSESYIEPMKLVKVNKGDWKPGDIIYTTDDDCFNVDINDLYNYNLVVDEKKYGVPFVYWCEYEIISIDAKFKHYYKVVPVN
jgi:hypothetical protein